MVELHVIDLRIKSRNDVRDPFAKRLLCVQARTGGGVVSDCRLPIGFEL